MRFLSVLASLFFFGCFLMAAAAFVVLLHFSMGLPDYHQLAVYQPQVTSRLYAADGSLLAEYATEKRTFVPVEKIPPLLRSAFLAAEDKNFYTHGGIDIGGLARALITNMQNIGTGKRLVGASTITQQVAKNFLLSAEQSLSRKMREALLARKIEQTFTKDHILELYLNEIYLGLGAYGVSSASLHYFDKSLDDLSLSEMAYLAALPKGPNNYHPVKNPEQAYARRDWVLTRMEKEGFITSAQAAEAMKERLVLANRSAERIASAGYYAEEVRRFVVQNYGEEAIYHGGLFIRTSLDPALQTAAVRALQDGLLAYDKRHGWRGPAAHISGLAEARAALKSREIPAYLPAGWRLALVTRAEEAQAHLLLPDDSEGTLQLADMAWARQALEGGRISAQAVQRADQVLTAGDIIYVQKKRAADDAYLLQQIPEAEGALIALDPHTGRVKAMTGGFDFDKNQFNRAIQAARQPGSAFKPFVYLAALDAGYTPSSLILDAPLVMEQPDGTKWKPKNYTKIFYGPTTLRVGVEKSRNLMTIRLARAIGMRRVVSYGKKFGISDKLEPVLSTALGAGETTLMKLTGAYGMLVNGGKKITPTLIDRIQDRNGLTIYRHDARPCALCAGDASDSAVIPDVPDGRAQIQDSASAYQMVNILTGVVERGTGRIVRPLKRTLAAKSGTSNDSVDAWFIGFSPDLAVGVWVGFDAPRTLGPNDTGGVVAGPIFRDFMKEALQNTPDIPFRVPASVQLVRVNAATGKPAAAQDKDVIMEAFRAGTDLSKSTPILGEDITIREDENIPGMGGLY